MFFPIKMSQVNNLVLATRVIIETHVVENAIRIIPVIIRKTTTESITQGK